MSYILDALRKSDEERRRGTTPTLLTPQIAAPEPARPRKFAFSLAAVALISVGVLIGIVAPWDGDAPSAPAKPAAARPADPPKAQLAAAVPIQPTQVAAPERAVPPQASPVKPPAPAPRPAASPRREPAKPTNKTVAPKTQSDGEAAVAKPAPKTAARSPERKQDAAPEQPQSPVVAFGDLPLAVQQEMPKLQVAAHAYSAVAGQRLVSINERIVREGDTVASGLVLEEITPSGMILSYRGYRFRRSAR